MMISRHRSIGLVLCVLGAAGIAGCADDGEYHLLGEVPVEGDSREFLVPLFAQVEGMQATIESSRLLWHRKCEPRQDRMEYFEWLYLVPEDAPLQLKEALDWRGSADILISMLNDRLRGKGISISEVNTVTRSKRWDIGSSEYSVDEVRSTSGRFLFIVCYRRF